MLIERAQAQGRDGNITICHVLWKKAILLHKRPKVEYSFSLTVPIIGWLLQIAVVLRFILIFRVFCGLDGEIQ